MAFKRNKTPPVPVKSAADLKAWSRLEMDQFYLVFDRNVCVFNKEYTMNKAEADRRFANIMIELQEAYVDAASAKRVEEVCEVALAVYMLPYRIH